MAFIKALSKYYASFLNMEGEKKSNSLSDYAASSTVHGIVYIFGPDASSARRTTLPERALWLVVVSGALGAAVVWSWKAYDNWRENPVITTVATMGYPIEKVI